MAISPDITVHSWYSRRYSKLCHQQDLSGDHNESSIQSLDISSILRYPAILRDPELYGIELRMRYEQALLDGYTLRTQLHSLKDLNKAKKMPSLKREREQSQLRLAYAAVLYYSLIMNAFLSALDSGSQYLPADAIMLATEAIETASVVLKDAPISLGFMPLCLFAASIATTDSKISCDIEVALLAYKDYFVEWHHRQRFLDAKKSIDEIKFRRLAYLREAGCC